MLMQDACGTSLSPDGAPVLTSAGSRGCPFSCALVSVRVAAACADFFAQNAFFKPQQDSIERCNEQCGDVMSEEAHALSFSALGGAMRSDVCGATLYDGLVHVGEAAQIYGGTGVGVGFEAPQGETAGL